MSQELTAKSNNALTTADAEADHLLDAAKQDAGFEKILKFKKTAYYVGDEIIPLGTEFLAHTTAWTKCWIKFADGELAERQLYRVAAGEQPVERERLDDNDQSKWSLGLDGKPADPWVAQSLLPLERVADGEIFVFCTPSIGGKRAIADLCAAFARRAKKGTFGQPVIKIQMTEMPTKRLGKVQRPLFEILSWDDGEPAQNDEGAADFDDALPY